ncbi:hypothetical protein [Sphingomonas sp. PB4P5]|uniref:hypothetical protein n=1 Tax=Parasphingomonas puruogangriensis TaxID=3096155 RepID=UPI002FCB9E7B
MIGDRLATLRADYPRDAAWERYAAVLRPAMTPDNARLVRRRVPEDEGLAETLVGVLGQAAALAWMERANDALDGFSPRQVMALGDDGI